MLLPIAVIDMQNIILIGMPGAGKSTIGVILAKSLLFDFCDTDLSIQKETGESLCNTISKIGIDEFIRLEEAVIIKQEFVSSVVATGGSAIYGEKAMEKLKENGIIVYLKVSPEELKNRIKNIHTRGIAMKEGTSISELYEERAPLYEKYADVTIECDGKTAEECVDLIVKEAGDII